MQEIVKQLKNYCAEAERVRQLRMDEVSFAKYREPSTVNQLVSQIQELQEMVNSPNDAR